MFLKVLLIQCLKSNCQKVKTTISKSLKLQYLKVSEVEHLINSGTYEPRNQGDTLMIKWKLQSPQ